MAATMSALGHCYCFLPLIPLQQETSFSFYVQIKITRFGVKIYSLPRTLLWKTEEDDLFVGDDLSAETAWKHKTISLPNSLSETKVYLYEEEKYP